MRRVSAGSMRTLTTATVAGPCGTEVAVGAGTAVGGTGVAVGRGRVAVGGTEVAVAGRRVAVGAVVLVAGIGVDEGTGVFVAAVVGVASESARNCAVAVPSALLGTVGDAGAGVSVG